MLAIQSPEERASRVPATISSQWREQMAERPLMEDPQGCQTMPQTGFCSTWVTGLPIVTSCLYILSHSESTKLNPYRTQELPVTVYFGLRKKWLAHVQGS